MGDLEVRRLRVSAGRDELWRVVQAVGGDRGWYGTSAAWAARGLLDRAVGGPGLRRGRPERLQAGDTVDCWRVEQVVPGALLRLRAEMRLPGTARLELEVEADGDRSVLVQRTSFEPHGPTGRAYWRAVAPLHGVVFARMLRGMAVAAERGDARAGPHGGLRAAAGPAVPARRAPRGVGR